MLEYAINFILAATVPAVLNDDADRSVLGSSSRPAG